LQFIIEESPQGGLGRVPVIDTSNKARFYRDREDREGFSHVLHVSVGVYNIYSNIEELKGKPSQTIPNPAKSGFPGDQTLPNPPWQSETTP
jgi:hypothetical protein